MASDEAELLSWFSPERMAPIADDELYGEWQEASFTSRAIPPPPLGDLARMAAQPELKPFLADLDNYLRKFNFGKGNVALWADRYIFPRGRSISTFCARPENRMCLPLVVNRDLLTVRSWIEDEIIPAVKGEEEKIWILIGGVGSGKSTFNKYVTSIFFPSFQNERVVTSRIEYKKMYAYVTDRFVGGPNMSTAESASLRVIIQQYVYCCIMRDIFHYGWSTISTPEEKPAFSSFFRPESACVWPELDLLNENVEEEFKKFCRERYGQLEGGDTSSLIKKALYEVRSAMAAFRSKSPLSRKRWFHELLADEERQAALQPFAQFAWYRGVRIYVIMDGLDYVQVADFIAHTTHRMLLVGVADWLLHNRRTVYLDKTRDYLYPFFQVTMRTNTYELFWLDFSQSLQEIECLVGYVVPPGIQGCIPRDIAR